MKKKILFRAPNLFRETSFNQPKFASKLETLRKINNCTKNCGRTEIEYKVYLKMQLLLSFYLKLFIEFFIFIIQSKNQYIIQFHCRSKCQNYNLIHWLDAAAIFSTSSEAIACVFLRFSASSLAFCLPRRMASLKTLQ